jgi:hypothetical protein
MVGVDVAAEDCVGEEEVGELCVGDGLVELRRHQWSVWPAFAKAHYLAT